MRSPGLPAAHFLEDRFLAETDLLAPGGWAVPAKGDSPLRVSLPLAAPELDLSTWDGLLLTVTNQADRPLAVGVRVFHGGDERTVSTTGGREPLLPDEPRQLFFPWSGFGAYGRPGGYGRITAIEVFFRRERDRSGPVRLAAAITALCAVRRKPLSGPRLSLAGLQHSLARPLEMVLGPRRFPAFARLPEALAVPAPVFPYPADTLARVRRGTILGHSVGLPPDWTADPEGELEWRHFLHRQHFLRQLSREAGQAGTVAEILADWIRRHPVPVGSDGGAGPSFETLSVAWRLREWISVLAALWNHPACTPDARSLILRSIWEQARHLADHQGHPGNWRFVEAAALGLVGLVFPEFREAESWAAEGLARLDNETAGQFLADGFHLERSPLYHGLCAQAGLEVFLAAREAGRPVPDNLERGLHRWFAVLAALARPDGTWPSLNDSGSADRDFRPLLRLARKALGTGRGRPRSVPVLLPQTGFAVLRHKRHWVLFKAGPKPPAHAHDDDLSLDVCLDGRSRLVDPGISRYAPSALTDAYRSAAAHACLAAEAPLGRAEGLSLASGKGFRVVSAERRGGGMVHRREVCLLDAGIVVVRDTLSGTVATTAHVHWQFAPGPLRFDRRTGRARGDGLRFVPVLDGLPFQAVIRRGETDPPGGFVSLCGRDRPAPRLDYVCRLDRPCQLWWVLLRAGTVRRTRDGLTISRKGEPTLRILTDPWRVQPVPVRRTSGKTRP